MNERKEKKPTPPLAGNSMCVNIPVQTERQKGLVKILQVS